MLFVEQRLLARLRNGDRRAYIEVAERYHKEIWSYIYRLCHDYELASDICQETAITLWQHAPEFKGIKTLRAWIYRVAHNIFIDHCRKARHNVLSYDDSRSIVDDNTAHDMLTAIAIKDDISDALNSLPDNHRDAIILIKVQGLTYKEASSVLNVPAGTIKWWVNQGIVSMRQSLSEIKDE